MGREVTVGLRPEHLRLQEEGRAPAGAVVLEMEVVLVERLRPASLVCLQRGDWAVTVRCEGRSDLREQAVRRVELALRGAHLFDRATGLALAHGLSGP